MSISIFRHLLLATAVCLLLSCHKEDPKPLETGSIHIEFDNVVGDENLVLNGKTYTNAAGEEFIVSKLDYFVSNFVLFDDQGRSFTIPQDSSYFLIREEEKKSQIVTLNNIPFANYVAVEFMVGVDSARSVSPIEKRKGVLDPGEDLGHSGMYWSWNSGYIFLKMEGSSEAATSANGKFYYHIGLFGGYSEPTVNNTRIVRVNFGEDKASVSSTKIPQVHLFADILKIFDGPGTLLKISEYNSIMGGQPDKAAQVADNYKHMFTYDHTH